MRIVRVAIVAATMLLVASPAYATPPVLVNDTSHPSVVTVTDANPHPPRAGDPGQPLL